MLYVIALLLAMISPPQEDQTVPSERLGEPLSPIVAMAIDGSGKKIFTLFEDGSISAWDVKKRKLLWSQSHEMPKVGIAVGREHVVTTILAPGMLVMRMIAIENGEETSKGNVGLPAKSGRRSRTPTCLAFDRKERWVWIGDDGGIMSRLTPGNANAWNRRVMDNGGVTCIAVDKKWKKMAVGGRNGTIRFINPVSATRDEKKIFEGHSGGITALAWDAKAFRLATASSSGELWIWSASSGKILKKLEEQEDPVCSLVFDPKGKRLAAGNGAGAVRIYNLKDGALAASLETEDASPVTGLAHVDKGKTLVTASAIITFWDLTKIR